MSKIIKICKISYVLYGVVIIGRFILSIIINITDTESNTLVHAGGGWQYYIPTFFSSLATVLFFYLSTIFVEKWCKKNDIK
jgi:hypothetical protein